MKKVIICGIPYEVITKEVIDCEGEGKTLGHIDYANQKITLREDLPEETRKETLIHEMIHGILCHIGRDDLNNEDFVQSMANALFNSSIEIKE